MLLNQTRMENTFGTTATPKITLPSSTELFRYVVKETKKKVIVISSDEGSDDDEQPATSSIATNENASQPRIKKPLKRKRSPITSHGNRNDPISLSDSEDEDYNNNNTNNNASTSAATVAANTTQLPPPSQESQQPAQDIPSPTQEELEIFAEGHNGYDDDEMMFNPINTLDTSIEQPTPQPEAINQDKKNESVLHQQQQQQQEIYVLTELQEKSTQIELDIENAKDDPSALSDMDIDSVSLYV